MYDVLNAILFATSRVKYFSVTAVNSVIYFSVNITVTVNLNHIVLHQKRQEEIASKQMDCW